MYFSSAFFWGWGLKCKSSTMADAVCLQFFFFYMEDCSLAVPLLT